MKSVLVLLLATAAVVNCLSDVDPYGQLQADLLKDYNPTARPGTPTDGVTVRMGLTVLSVSMREWESSILVNSWVPLMWEDKRLQWSPEQYSGISVLRVPPKKIWTPDLAVYNELPQNSKVQGPEKLLLIFNNGTVLWVPNAMLKQQCQLDLQKFPMDTQNCELQIGSWTYDTKEVDVRLWDTFIGMDKYSVVNEWAITETKAERRDDVYPNIDGSYASVIFKFKLQRRAASYCITLYAPIVACIFASIASLFASRNGPSSKSEHIVISLLTTSILVFVAIQHGTSMKVSFTGLPNIFKFVGFLVILEALFLPIKGMYVSVISSMHNEMSAKFYGTKPLPRCVAAMIGVVPFLGKSKGSEGINADYDKMVEAMSDDCRKNVSDWKRFSNAVWVSMMTTYMFALCALIFSHFAY